MLATVAMLFALLPSTRPKLSLIFDVTEFEFGVRIPPSAPTPLMLVYNTERWVDLFYLEKIELKPIGFVKTKALGKEVRDKSNVSEIILHSSLAEALEGIADFSHLFVIFWMHEISNKERRAVKVHPRGRLDMPMLGVFATRTPHRQNPIGLTLVELIGVQGNIVTVRGLDAFNGTPVLDIKPFDPWDLNDDLIVPKWWVNLEKERLEKQKSCK